MKYIYMLLIVILIGCVKQIDRPDVPQCCQSLYDVLYLNQRAKINIDVQSLLDCCRKQQKWTFCYDATDTQKCLDLMKTF